MANKALGQHWLKNRGILDEIAALAVPEMEVETCLEIGPGLGTLTSALLRRFSKVIAVEYDADLARKLPGSFPGKNLEVINEDFLEFNLSGIPAPYVVAGNIPYYITSPIIEKLLMTENPPLKIVLLMQKEVAERICDEERASLLSLRCQNRTRVELGPVVLREEFEPAPKVDSQVVVFEPLGSPLVGEEVMKLIQRGFAQPRKKLIHNLVSVGVEHTDGTAQMFSKEKWLNILEQSEVDKDARPSELGLEDWQRIYDVASKA